LTNALAFTGYVLFMAMIVLACRRLFRSEPWCHHDYEDIESWDYKWRKCRKCGYVKNNQSWMS